MARQLNSCTFHVGLLVDAKNHTQLPIPLNTPHTPYLLFDAYIGNVIV